MPPTAAAAAAGVDPNEVHRANLPGYFANVDPATIKFSHYLLTSRTDKQKKKKVFGMRLVDPKTNKPLPLVTPFFRAANGNQIYPHGTWSPPGEEDKGKYPPKSLPSAKYSVMVSAAAWRDGECSNETLDYDHPETLPRDDATVAFYAWMRALRERAIAYIASEPELLPDLREACTSPEMLQEALESRVPSFVRQRKHELTKKPMPGTEYVIMNRYMFNSFAMRRAGKAVGVSDPHISNVLASPAFREKGTFEPLPLLDCGTKRLVPYDQCRVQSGDIMACHFEIRIQETEARQGKMADGTTFNIEAAIRVDLSPTMLSFYRARASYDSEAVVQEQVQHAQCMDFGIQGPAVASPSRRRPSPREKNDEEEDADRHDAMLFGGGSAPPPLSPFPSSSSAKKRKVSPSNKSDKNDKEETKEEDNDDEAATIVYYESDESGHSAHSLTDRRHRRRHCAEAKDAQVNA